MGVVLFAGTITIGLSCPLAAFETVYGFFSNGTAHATQTAQVREWTHSHQAHEDGETYPLFDSACGMCLVCCTLQMLFRCRAIKRVYIAYTGVKNKFLPRDREGVARWLTSASNPSHCNLIPDILRGDRAPVASASANSHSDPTVLLALVEQSWPGQLWLGDMIEHFRSQRDFLGRLDFVLRKCGIHLQEYQQDAGDPEMSEEARKAWILADKLLLKDHRSKRAVAAEEVDAALLYTCMHTRRQTRQTRQTRQRRTGQDQSRESIRQQRKMR